MYDKTTTHLFFDDSEIVTYKDKEVIVLLYKSHSGIIYTLNDGRCLKRLGKNSKTWCLQENSSIYLLNQTWFF